MSFLGAIGSAIGGIAKGICSVGSKVLPFLAGGGGSSDDRGSDRGYGGERVTVVDDRSAVEVARLNKEKVELEKEAKLELVEAQKNAEIAIEEAKAKGFMVAANTMVMMQEKLTTIAENRQRILNSATSETIKDLEDFYLGLEKEIKEESASYNDKIDNVLIPNLSKYQEGTDAYNIYLKRIQDDMEFHRNYLDKKMDSVIRRQDTIIESITATQQKLLDQTGSMAEKLLGEMLENQKQLYAGVSKESILNCRTEALIEDRPMKDAKLLNGGK